jgi:hypothetical protein
LRYASKNDLKQLIKSPLNSYAISIFIPTFRVSLPHNLKADRVRFKNAIYDVSARLKSLGFKKEEINAYIAKLNKLREDNVFWKYRDNGLAIYAEKGKLTYFDLPFEIEPSTHLGQDYIISPLIASQGEAYKYYILELNNDEPRAFVASQSSAEKILEDKLPGNIENALRIDENQRQLQHATSPGGSRDAHTHGHGGANDHKYKDIEKYYRLIDKVLWDNVLKNSTMPLLIAGEEHSVSTYKNLSKYKHIHPAAVFGNYSHLGNNELHGKTWEIMVEQIEKQENIFMQIFEKAKHRDTKQALVNGEHIKRAAKQGRVAALAVGIIRKTYDSVVRNMEKRFKIALPANSRQLQNIEQAARDVINSGGDVSAMLYKNDDNSADTEQYIRAITR